MKGQRKFLDATRLVMGRGTDPDSWMVISIPIARIKEIADGQGQSSLEPWASVRARIITADETYYVKEERWELVRAIEMPYTLAEAK